jgi:tRNA pseudouridine55 synthase
MTSGFVVIDKPSGMTSHDVVAQVRRMCKTKRVGHAGTLDPMATGVLILGINNGTKALQFLSSEFKSYDAVVRLGSSTSTDDAEGEVLETSDASNLADTVIRAALAEFIGELNQVPSTVSAIKIDGKRAYVRARAGESVDIPARSITISEQTLHSISRNDPGSVDVSVSFTVSAGTYIRAIARDLGAKLQVGGHLTSLRRTASGGFGLTDAQSLQSEELNVLPLLNGLERFMPVLVAGEEHLSRISHGLVIDYPWPTPADPVCVVDSANNVLAIARGDAEGKLRYYSVFSSPSKVQA